MPTFAYAGRTRAGQTVSGEHIADTMDAAVAALRRQQIQITKIDPVKAKEAEAKPKAAKKGGRQGPVQEPGDLHPPVLGHDRRRPAAGAVSGHPRQAGAAQGVLGGHPQDPRGRRVGRRARRRDEEAPQDLRRALLEHDRGGRSGRYSRHHPQAAGDLHREVGQAEGGSEVRDDLPDRGRRHRRGGRRRHPVEGHPDVRPAVLRPRRPAAAADPRRHRRRATAWCPTGGF